MKKIIFGVFFLLFIFTVKADTINVGVSPSYLDLGEIEPGDSKIARFYIVTSSKEMFLVDLGSSKGTEDLFYKEGYESSLKFYSEEDTSKWIIFIENPVKLTPPNETLEKTKGGGIVSGLHEIIFILKIPKDAEPGYHTGMITLSPRVPGGEEGGVSIKAIIPMNFIFQVEGNVFKNGRILDVTNNGDRFGRLWLKIIFKNNGNITESLRGGEISIYDNDRMKINSVSTSIATVKPNEIKELDGFMDYENITDGVYSAKSKVDFVSGIAEWAGEIEIRKPSQVLPESVPEEKSNFPWKIIVIAIIVLAMYIILRK